MGLMDTTFEHLTATLGEDGVAVVKLNRPEVRNAVNRTLHRELTVLPTIVTDDPVVKVLVISGEGQSFCAGGDFSAAEGWADADYHQHQEGRRLVENFLGLEKPVIAAVRGNALGLGASIALLCDVVVVGPSTRIGDPHVRLGIAPGDGGALLWPLHMGPTRAKWYLMSGESISGRDIVDEGLATFFVDSDDEVLDHAVSRARTLAAGAQQAIAGAKGAVNQYLRFASTLVMPFAMAAEAGTLASPDHREAAQAFLEKRQPVFGRGQRVEDPS